MARAAKASVERVETVYKAKSFDIGALFVALSVIW